MTKKNYKLLIATLTLTAIANADNHLTLPDNIVYANRYAQEETKVAAATKTIQNEDIQGGTSLPQILEKNGVTTRSLSGNETNTEIALRGFGENSGQRVLILVDGQKINRPDMGNFNWAALPIENIESIEIIKGTQTALYGGNAVAGVIKIKTKKPDPNKGAQTTINAQYGSYNFQNFTISTNGNKEKWGYTATATQQSSDGYRDCSDNDTTSLTAGINYNPTKTIETGVGISTFKGSYSQPDSLTKAQMDTNPKQAGSNPSTGFDKGTTIAPFIKITPDDNHQIDINGAATKKEMDYFRKGWGIEWMETAITQKSATIQYGANTNNNEALKIILGTTYEGSQIDFQEKSTWLGNPKAQVNQDNLAGFTHITYQINEKTSIHSSARIEASKNKVDFKDGTRNNDTLKGNAYQIGANYQALKTKAQTLTIWTRYDKTYRYPTTDELATYQGGGSSYNYLKPETGNNYELGTTWKSKKWRLQATGFHQNMKDEITFVNNSTAPFFGKNENIQQTKRYGYEVSAEYTEKNWTAGATYENIKALYDYSNKKDKWLPLIPKEKATVFLEYTLHQISLLGRINYQGAFMESGGSTRIGGWATFDTKVSFYPTDNMEIFTEIDNITDKITTSSVIWGGWYPNPGRTAKIGMKYTF